MNAASTGLHSLPLCSNPSNSKQIKSSPARGSQGIDKVDAPEENERSFSSECKFSCALNSARPENLRGMKNSAAGASSALEFMSGAFRPALAENSRTGEFSGRCGSSATYTPPPAEKGAVSLGGSPFHVQKEPGSVKRPANAVEYCCEKNQTAKRL